MRKKAPNVSHKALRSFSFVFLVKQESFFFLFSGTGKCCCQIFYGFMSFFSSRQGFFIQQEFAFL